MQPKASPDKEATEPTAKPDDAGTPPVHPNTLTRFQVDTLAAIAHRHERLDEPPHGLGLKEELEERYGEEVNHGRLYPNLDDLVGLGLVAKEEADLRTNHYILTQLGAYTLNERVDWLAGSGGEE